MAFRWRIIVTVALAAISQAAWARWPDGVLNYCGFEGYWDEAGWRDLGWAQGGTEGMCFDRQTKRFGKAALRIEGANAQSRAALQLNGNAVQRGKSYTLRAWIKTQDIAGEAALALQPHEEGKPLAFFDLGETSRLRGTRDWTLVVIRIPPIPEKVVRVFPYVWAKGPGTAWFDELALTEAGTEVPLGGEKPITEADYAGIRFDDAALPANLLGNPGFEEALNQWYVEHGKPKVDEQFAVAGRRSLRLQTSCAFARQRDFGRLLARDDLALSVRDRQDSGHGHDRPQRLREAFTAVTHVSGRRIDRGSQTQDSEVRLSKTPVIYDVPRSIEAIDPQKTR